MGQRSQNAFPPKVCVMVRDHVWSSRSKTLYSLNENRLPLMASTTHPLRHHWIELTYPRDCIPTTAWLFLKFSAYQLRSLPSRIFRQYINIVFSVGSDHTRSFLPNVIAPIHRASGPDLVPASKRTIRKLRTQLNGKKILIYLISAFLEQCETYPKGRKISM